MSIFDSRDERTALQGQQRVFKGGSVQGSGVFFSWILQETGTGNRLLQEDGSSLLALETN